LPETALVTDAGAMTTKPRGNPAIDPAAMALAHEALMKIAGH
jgi:hypothetical protein